MVLSLAATTVSNARTPGSFTDTLIKWLFILITVVILAIIAAVVYFFFFSDFSEAVTNASFNPLFFIPGIGGFLSLVSRF